MVSNKALKVTQITNLESNKNTNTPPQNIEQEIRNTVEKGGGEIIITTTEAAFDIAADILIPIPILNKLAKLGFKLIIQTGKIIIEKIRDANRIAENGAKLAKEALKKAMKIEEPQPMGV